MNYRLIAIQSGDMLKNLTTLNEIDRAATSVYKFQVEDFPNESITSQRAKRIHDWVLTLGKQLMDNDERNRQLKQFLMLLAPNDALEKINKMFETAGISDVSISEAIKEFSVRYYHEEIQKHCKKLFNEGNYFHAVFEAAKVYNKKVQEKSQSTRDGQALMMDVWTTNGVLKLTECKSETDRNVQEGIKFLSAGLMQALRNPTAHEPALDWPISKEDCLDLLSFISHLFRQLDKAVYYKD